ncbi:MAG: hypothetical protein L3J34_09095 [Flavobacteriaceae bacterium]|nr:hypothetical protein [Flavobacteriaceae bacterium]
MDKDKKIVFTSYPKNHKLLGDLKYNPKVKKLIAICESWYTITKVDGKLYLNDLRFGLLSMKPKENRFVFIIITTPKIRGIGAVINPKLDKFVKKYSEKLK